MELAFCVNTLKYPAAVTMRGGNEKTGLTGMRNWAG